MYSSRYEIKRCPVCGRLLDRYQVRNAQKIVVRKNKHASLGGKVVLIKDRCYSCGYREGRT